MDKLKTLVEAYEAAISAGMVKTKKEFAARLGVNYSGLIAAMSGDDRYLTGPLVAKACALLNGRELPKRETTAQPRTEDTGKTEQMLAVMLNQSETIRLQVETFKRALDMIDDARAGALGAKRGESPRISELLQENR